MEKEAKSEAALHRCAKAALLLCSLHSANSEDEEKWKREIHDLRIQLLKERLMKKKIKLCAFMELMVELFLLLSLWTFFLLFLINSL